MYKSKRAFWEMMYSLSCMYTVYVGVSMSSFYAVYNSVYNASNVVTR